MAARSTAVFMLAIALAAALAAPAEASVSIVAVDPVTGQVGIAGASCVQFDLARVATVVPGAGAAASQGRQRRGDPLLLLDELRRGGAPSAVLDRVASSDAPSRQFGVVTLASGASTRSGEGLEPVATDASTETVAVIGNDLSTPRVVDRAKYAFMHAPGDLAHRLVAALKASSAAGGDRRCGVQTATAAFIIVASRGQHPVVPIRGLAAVAHRRRKVLRMVGRTVAADELGDLLREAAGLRRPSGPGSPDLYLSFIQPLHGFDAVSLLAQAYQQLLSTPTATPTPGSAPSSTPAAGGIQQEDQSRSSGQGILFALAAVGGLVLLSLWIRARRRRCSRRVAGALSRTKT
jgi:hypothetical protein